MRSRKDESARSGPAHCRAQSVCRGTIPNPKLASGVNIHAFLAKAVEEQSGRGREPTGDLEFEAVDEALAQI